MPIRPRADGQALQFCGTGLPTRELGKHGSGEPCHLGAVALSAQGFNEGKGKPFTAEDVRYTTSKDGRTLYAIVLGWPTKPLALKSLGVAANLLDRPIQRIELLGAAEAVS